MAITISISIFVHNLKDLTWAIACSQHMHGRINDSRTGYCAEAKNFTHFLQILGAISRTAEPTLGLFVLIWIHFSCWIQIWQWKCKFKIFEMVWKFLHVLCSQHLHGKGSGDGCCPILTVSLWWSIANSDGRTYNPGKKKRVGTLDPLLQLSQYLWL